jgi:ElaB/YqjD/DUF883 family membrane-anchored ribosome-binding protein
MTDNGGGSNLSDEAREAAQKAREAARGVARDVEERLEGMRGYADDAGEWLRTLARDKPMIALGLAVGVGFVFGRLLSRT